jgi:hypothetical protein
LIFYEYRQECGTSEKMNDNIALEQFCPLSYWLMAGIWAFPSGFPIDTFSGFPRGYPTAFGRFLGAFLYPFSSAQQLSNSLLEHFPAAVGKNMASLCHFCMKGQVSDNIY